MCMRFERVSYVCVCVCDLCHHSITSSSNNKQVHENFSANVERTQKDFYWLHKSLLSEHPKQRLPRLVFSDEESLSRYLNAIMTHELLISKASSVCHILYHPTFVWKNNNTQTHKHRYGHFWVSRPELRLMCLPEHSQRSDLSKRRRTARRRIVL